MIFKYKLPSINVHCDEENVPMLLSGQNMVKRNIAETDSHFMYRRLNWNELLKNTFDMHFFKVYTFCVYS